MFWISRITQGELLEYIAPGEVKKLNLLEILQWRVQAQCYIPKFPPFIAFQAGTRGGDIGEEAVLEFARGPVCAERAEQASITDYQEKNAPEMMPREEKKKKDAGKEENSPLLCVRDLNTWIDSHGQAMSQSETNSLSSRRCLNWFCLGNLQGKTPREQRSSNEAPWLYSGVLPPFSTLQLGTVSANTNELSNINSKILATFRQFLFYPKSFGWAVKAWQTSSQASPVRLIAVTREQVSGESLPAVLAQEKGDLLDESKCRKEN